MDTIKINLPFNKEINKINNLILGHFNLIHYGHYQLLKELNNFSFLIFENNPSKFKRPYSLDERINNLSRYNPNYIFVYDILNYQFVLLNAFSFFIYPPIPLPTGKHQNVLKEVSLHLSLRPISSSH